jgi:hypothetical protein
MKSVKKKYRKTNQKSKKGTTREVEGKREKKERG